MFDAIPSQLLFLITSVGAVMMAIFVMFVRLRSQKNPVNEKKIIIPPIAMSTGALMFLFEEFRVAPLQILEATAIGILFSTVLIATSKFEARDGAIYLKRSKAFVLILVGLLVLRIILKLLFSNSLDVGELGGMFFILAWAMIIPWRLAMLVQFKKLKRTIVS
ncbi:cytochrome c biogenesis protein CcdC [Lysinibacillus sp. KU-BSD001]|uniref:CcdC family protein n=1 Tax=Lysinibacillus sp. KU-BSD001 TaxID=3141328 RepID=UPI0036E69683